MASTSASPASIDELVEFIAAIVNKRFRDSHQATNGALLAEELRRRYPDLQYERLGLLKLSDAVAHAEAKGLVLRNREVKHLEIQPSTEGVSFTDSTTHGQGGVPPHIRQDIWRAFVFVSPGQQFYYDRETGTVAAGSAPTQFETGGRYIAITALALAEQQQWMRDFLAAHSKLRFDDAPINDPFCFTRFPHWLNQNEPGLDRVWKQYRVQRVAECVRQWATTNAIDPTIFFSMPLASQKTRGEQLDSQQEARVRAAIIAAARELPIQELQNIAIPLRYVLEALKGR